MMDRWRGKTAVVTGAAGGIGAAISKSLLTNQINVVGLDIQTEFLKIMSSHFSNSKNFGIFYGITCDVSRGDDLSRAFQLVEEKFHGIDIMINNAGVIDYTRITEADRTSFERLINTNVLAVATCISAAVKSMRNRQVEGHIININSVLGHEIPFKGLSEVEGANGFNLYPACKHATVAMTHSTRRELSELKLPIKITSISPGLVKTGIAKAIPGGNLFDRISALEPEDVAEAVLYALGTRPGVQVSELTIQRTGEP